MSSFYILLFCLFHCRDLCCSLCRVVFATRLLCHSNKLSQSVSQSVTCVVNYSSVLLTACAQHALERFTEFSIGGIYCSVNRDAVSQSIYLQKAGCQWDNSPSSWPPSHWSRTRSQIQTGLSSCCVYAYTLMHLRYFLLCSAKFCL